MHFGVVSFRVWCGACRRVVACLYKLSPFPLHLLTSYTEYRTNVKQYSTVRPCDINITVMEHVDISIKTLRKHRRSEGERERKRERERERERGRGREMEREMGGKQRFGCLVHVSRPYILTRPSKKDGAGQTCRRQRRVPNQRPRAYLAVDFGISILFRHSNRPSGWFISRVPARRTS